MALGAIVPILDIRNRNAELAELRNQNPDFDSQLVQLETTEEQLKAVLAFVHSQKDRVQDFQSKIDSLRTEQTELEPVVQANREVVEALFSLQERRQQTRVWRERWIGFGFGVLASLIASAIWYFVIKAFRRRATLAKLPVTSNKIPTTSDE
ncbi:MAG: hypothetical protein JW806_01475 [Sedimentisphaerales bacterium]|nr:hypothetical protein [Sedimentisphaerales bacterium]